MGLNWIIRHQCFKKKAKKLENIHMIQVRNGLIPLVPFYKILWLFKVMMFIYSALLLSVPELYF